VGDGSNNWDCMTSSSDGTKLAAAAAGYGTNIWTSSNSGTSWTEVVVGQGAMSWDCITSSDDGTKLAASGGVRWTTEAWADGQVNRISPDCSPFWISSDSGASWTEVTGISGIENERPYYGITSSGDGLKLAAVAYRGSIWTSGDSGSTWTKVTGPTENKDWLSITSSSDGVKLWATAADSNTDNEGHLWTSTNSGVAWTEVTSVAGVAVGMKPDSITASSNGEKLALVDWGQHVRGEHTLNDAVNFGHIYTSGDFGATWTKVNVGTGNEIGKQVWTGLTSSSDGTKLAAVAYAGDVWASNDSGATWTKVVVGGPADGSDQVCTDTTSPMTHKKNWKCIASSGDGAKLFAGARHGNLWISV